MKLSCGLGRSLNAYPGDWRDRLHWGHLVEELFSRYPDAKVGVLGRPSRENKQIIYHLLDRFRSRVRFLRVDVRDESALESVIRDYQLVYHLAAQPNPDMSILNPRETVDVNVNGTMNVLEAALKSINLERIVVVSSSEVYGEPVYTPVDENHPFNVTHIYSASKAAADVMARAYHRSYGLPVVVARPFNTYGPRQKPPALIPSIIERVKREEPVTVFGSGEQRRDYLFVKDTVSGLLLMGEKGRAGEAYNLASGRSWSILEIIDTIGRLTGIDVKVEFAAGRPAEPSNLVGSYEKARRELGWEPRYAFEEGLRLTLESYGLGVRR